MKEVNEFSNLTFDDFRELAADNDLSRHEKVGFPDEYREGKEEAIFLDICTKLPALNSTNKRVLEIGPGCSELPVMLMDLCRQHDNELFVVCCLLFVDSAEMLALLPDGDHVEKWTGRYPDTPRLFEKYANKIDVIIAYSVIQYAYVESNLWDFLDRSLSLLADGGMILFGDVPNITMRKRFFSSAAGIQCHRDYTGSDELPNVSFNQLELAQMDDSVVFALLSRARAQGFHAWVVPQASDLPMANRREDILIRRP
ncbi:MAG: hypothetical protein ABW168_12455 [Sedimenticola sp.]